MRLIRLLVVTVALGLSGNAAARVLDLDVRTLDGVSVPLSTYFEPGKWTMVMMWTTYCGICRRQYPVVSAFHDRHKDTDAKVIGISLDGYAEAAKVRAYITARKMSFDSTIAEADAIAAVYKTITGEAFTGTPTYLMFAPDGVLVAHVPGVLTMKAVEDFIRDNGE
jgi:thiol-disulfide isomerase/thioredoxin